MKTRIVVLSDGNWEPIDGVVIVEIETKGKTLEEIDALIDVEINSDRFERIN